MYSVYNLCDLYITINTDRQTDRRSTNPPSAILVATDLSNQFNPIVQLFYLFHSLSSFDILVIKTSLNIPIPCSQSQSKHVTATRALFIGRQMFQLCSLLKTA